MHPNDELYEKVVAAGRRRRRRGLGMVVAGVFVVGTLLGGPSLLDRGDRHDVIVSAPGTTVVKGGVGPLELPADDGSLGVLVPEELPEVPGEAPTWTARDLTVADVTGFATAIGVGGTATRTPDGFEVTGGNVVMTVVQDALVGWRFELATPCDPGRCVVPDDGPVTAPEPRIETRPAGFVAPDDPPAESVATAAEVAQRVASHLGGDLGSRLSPALGEWHADLTWMAGDVPASQFMLAIRPDGSVRWGSGQLVRPGEPAEPVPLIGVLEALHRLNAPPRTGFGSCASCSPFTVTDVALGYTYVDGRFEPSYWFTTTDYDVRQIPAT